MLNINFVFKNFSDEEKEILEDYINKKIRRIEKLLDEKEENLARLEVKAERFATKSAYKINLNLHLPNAKVLASEDDHTIREAVDLAMDKLIMRFKKFFKK